MAKAAKDIVTGEAGAEFPTSPKSSGGSEGGSSPPQTLSRRQSSLHDAHAQKLIAQYNQEKERALAKVTISLTPCLAPVPISLTL